MTTTQDTATTRPADRFDDLPADLATVLRTGPFHLALDLAIRHHRLSLESVQRRMAGREARVSQATLSYWRRGQRRPEGDRSLRAVHALEDCLGLPRDALVRLIGPQRPRGRWLGHVPGSVGLDTALDIEPALLTTFDGIDVDVNTRMTIVSLHDRVRIGPDRTEQSAAFEFTVISKVDGVDRWVCFLDPRDGDGHRPMLIATDSCRPGRLRTDPHRDLLAVELRFDYPLRVGDSYVFGYEIGYAGTAPRSDFFQHGIRTPARQLTIQTRFDPAAVPVRCYRYHGSRNVPVPSHESELPVGSSLTSHLMVLDAQPGIHGMRWEWD